MSSPARITSYLARILLDWLNTRYGTNHQLSVARDSVFIATDGDRRLGLYIATLWDDDAGWNERLDAAAQRLSGAIDGAYLLWVPPSAGVPLDEPDATYFAERVTAAARGLEPSARTEVMFPVKVGLKKLRDEGGYASVTGGLSRWWTRITENVQGTFAVDSSAVHRITHDGAAREELWEQIGRLSHGVDTGGGAEFEIDEAWTLQRLADDAGSGFALAGAPLALDPTDGTIIRRTARKRLAAANEALAPLDVHARTVGLLGAYEYAEVETASGTVKAVDPSLYARLEAVCVLADGDVRPVFLPKALS
jgi:hypothetical protein